MNVYLVISVLCGTLLLSYLVGLFSKRFRVPAVLILLAIGMALRPVLDETGTAIPDLSMVLQLLGVLGLIFIVLEAALDLRINRRSYKALIKGLSASVLLLVASTAGIAYVLVAYFDIGLQAALLNAIPVSVMSSAVTIPAVSHLAGDKKSFLTYEATFSDVFGVMLFNLVLTSNGLSPDIASDFAGDFLLVVLLALVCSIVLVMLLDKVRSEAKFMLVLSVLILAYSLGKLLHLSSLLIVLVFGMALANRSWFVLGRLKRKFAGGRLEADIRHFRVFVGESSFFIRTFFFVAFGMSIPLSAFFDPDAALIALFVIGVVYLTRAVFLRFAAGIQVFPELFVAPRGLITILLYYSVPETFRLGAVYDHAVFLVILFSNLMMLGMRFVEHGKIEECFDCEKT